jgi:signal transduction histidine kinase
VKAPSQPQESRVAGFRTKLVIGTMLVVATVTLLALYFTQRRLAADVAEALEREFQSELAALNHAQEVRRAALVERCRALVRKPRIHAALEDDALDLLYPSAEDELRDVMARGGASNAMSGRGLQAEFYRFLDRDGNVIPPTQPRSVGLLEAGAESRLRLPGRVDRPQIGYLPVAATATAEPGLLELVAMPIISLETGESIAVLVLGFKPFAVRVGEATGMKSGIWLEGAVYGVDLPPPAVADLAPYGAETTTPMRVVLDGSPHLFLSKRLNPDSHYAAAFEVCVYPLAGLVARQRQVRWQVLGAGTLMLLVGLLGSQVLATRLSAPVEKLAVDSEENRTQRQRVEAALEMTSAELQRSARFSADASHQLKTPVTVLRAGLEELLAHQRLTPEHCQDVSALIHQTFRLSTLIDDLLLLSRMDAGRLKLELARVDLSRLIEASLDDLSALPDEVDISVETDLPPELQVVGEQRYTSIILQNLLENARKYNRPGGRIRISARVQGEAVRLAIANTGPVIPDGARAHIFERFHRGDLVLTRSDENGTEFELTLARAAPGMSS